MPVSDTSPAAANLLIEGYRSMSPTERLQRVASLNRALDEVTAAMIRAQSEVDLPEHRVAELAAARYLDKALLEAVLSARARRPTSDGAD